mmetsp:Transcript_54549/g.130131  ORF Transcript_54549/g.130131 Transcript_54549/m.130131 type:complete len:268 (+) Transcript_54549:1066-1869(+)
MASVVEMPKSSRVSAMATSSEGRWENLGPTLSNVCSRGSLALAADSETGALFSTMARLSCVLGRVLLLVTCGCCWAAAATAGLRIFSASLRVLLLCMVALPLVATRIIKLLPLADVAIIASEPFHVMTPSLLFVVMLASLPACVVAIEVIRAMLRPAVGLLRGGDIESVEPILGSMMEDCVMLLLLIIEIMPLATLSSAMELPVVRGVLSMLLGLSPGVAVDTPEYMRETSLCGPRATLSEAKFGCFSAVVALEAATLVGSDMDRRG